MEVASRGLGLSQLRIKYRETHLQKGPSGISGYLGTLRKGAVVEIIGDNHPYYYFVRLDNGLEGYVYKDAGEVTSGVMLTRPVTTQVEPAPKETVTPAAPVAEKKATEAFTSLEMESPFTPAPRTSPATTHNGNLRSSGSPSSVNGSASRRNASYSASSNRPRPGNRTASTVVVTTGEIAVFDRPGIVGTQVGKLRRGEQASLLGEDSFFFQVSLTNGAVGYIPRYAAETL
ncbi:MAG TPA: SH3 domain-containing protein [Chloroflexia bacterium]|nr:SH3 domain-containing protein [Chloroflexia bacterium]